MTYPIVKRRSRLRARFRPIIDGLFDLAKARAERSEEENFERDWFGGQWQKSRPFSYELEITERTSGNPLNTLGRAIDGIHRGEIESVAIVAIGTDGVIHTAWSDGNLPIMGKAAGWLSDDLAKAAKL